jgi:hypothetical protein
MNQSISKLKEQSELSFQKILKELERTEAYSKRDWGKLRYGGKIKEAIVGQDEFIRMAKCRGGVNACGSVFCPKCNKAKVAEFHKDILDYYEDKFSSREWLARKQLRYGTVLHQLIPVNVDNLFNEDGVIRDLIVSIARLKENLTIVENELKKDKVGKDVIAIGTIHLELLDIDMFRIEKSGRESDKQRTLRRWLEKNGVLQDYYFLVHAHFMIDNRTLTKEKLEAVFRSIPEWNITKEQVLIKRFSSKYSGGHKHLLTDAFENISEYAYSGSNHRLRFNSAWGSSDDEYKQQEKRDGMYRLSVYAEKTGRPNVSEDLSVGQTRLLIKAHNTFTDDGEDQLRIGIGL